MACMRSALSRLPSFTIFFPFMYRKSYGLEELEKLEGVAATWQAFSAAFPKT